MVREQITFGQWVRRRRRTLDLTQGELADLLGYSTITVRRVEAGTRRPSKQLVERLLQHLEVPEPGRPALRALGRQPVGLPADEVGPAPDEVAREDSDGVPSPLGEMVGREKVLQHVLGTFETGARLVTITGPGGVGKTRLAVAVAQARGRAGDRVTWVSLVSSRDAGRAARAVRDAAREPLPSTVVLDGYEHVMETLRAVVSLLEVAPQVTVLVTTRTSLAVPGGCEVALAPLEVPTGEDLAPGALLSHDAVALFLAAARRVQPGLDLVPATAAGFVTVCRELDGLPLALEIAADNLRVLSVADLAERLSAGHWPEPQKGSSLEHQDLREVLRAGEARLTPGARLLLARASVFAGGWTLAAAESVCTDERLPRAGMVALLAELSRHSLTRLVPGAITTRYALLNTVSRRAAERLAEAGRTRVEERHTAYYQDVAARAATSLLGREQVRWMGLVGADLDNLRAVLARHLSSGTGAHDVERARCALSMAAHLERYWLNSGRLGEGLRWARAALDLPAARAGACLSSRMAALSAVVALESARGHDRQAWVAAQEMSRLAPHAAGPQGLATALCVLGTLAVRRPGSPHAEMLLRQCLAVAEPDRGRAVSPAPHAMLALGAMAQRRHDDVLAEDLYGVAVSALWQEGDLRMVSTGLRWLAQVRLRLRGPAAAVPLLHQSLHHAQALGARCQTAAALVGLAEVARALGRHSEAAECLGRAGSLLALDEGCLSGSDREQWDACLGALHERLGTARLQALMEAGAGTPVEQWESWDQGAVMHWEACRGG
jgi:predicted ATPase/transcriptional regulator with XRE-family HTH domain